MSGIHTENHGFVVKRFDQTKYVRCAEGFGCGRFLLTHAHGLVSRRLEAIVAETTVAALRVDTLAMTAHIRNLLALITV